MSLKTPTAKDFQLSPLPERPGVLAVFTPTDSHYVFTILTDPGERARVGSLLSPEYQLHHKGTGDIGDYVGSEVLEVARGLALAMARKLAP
jgi:hypothetical protein